MLIYRYLARYTRVVSPGIVLPGSFRQQTCGPRESRHVLRQSRTIEKDGLIFERCGEVADVCTVRAEPLASGCPGSGLALAIRLDFQLGDGLRTLC